MLRHASWVVLSLTTLAGSVLGGAAVSGCAGDGDPYLPPLARDAAIPPGVDGGVPGTDTGPAGPSGLPCDVAMVIGTYCTSCHGATPAGGAYSSLMTRDQLLADSTSRPGMPVVDVAIARMHEGSMPPPPATSVPAADIGILEAWLAAGTPVGDCSTPTDPAFSGPDTCTSGTTWMPSIFNEGDEFMRPGEACIACHTREREGPHLYLAGTVYATGHEYDDCNGQPSSGADPVVVEVTDATGNVVSMRPNSAGNFMDEDIPVTFPITAVVRYQGRTRAMATPVSSGDCNSCHTLRGTMDAPGRIALP